MRETVRVELARPVSDHVTIPVSFLLVGSSGIGEISLPRIEPPALRVGRRVVALSVEPALQFELPPIEQGTVMTVTDFLTHWGGAPRRRRPLFNWPPLNPGRSPRATESGDRRPAAASGSASARDAPWRVSRQRSRRPRGKLLRQAMSCSTRCAQHGGPRNRDDLARSRRH